MAEEPDDSQIPKPADLIRAFLTTAPPGTTSEIPGAKFQSSMGNETLWFPDIHLHCPDEQCGGYRQFTTKDDPSPSKFDQFFLLYRCRNCVSTEKTFALRGRRKNGLISLTKMGEIPPFGPVVPEALLKLFGEDRELFLKGRRSENQGLGIGAFVYYRRVVEAHWQRLLKEIRRVAAETGAPQESLKALTEAQKEDQFGKALDMVKEAIPQALWMAGQNPIAILFKAVSQELHAGTDESALESAHDVRVVLTELTARMAQILRDDAELRASVDRLRSSKVSGRSG